MVPIYHSELGDSIRTWNHNEHYHQRLLALLPEVCESILDIGCGDGRFTKKLLPHSQHVTAIDKDPSMVNATRAITENIEVMSGDFLQSDQLAESSFDAITCVMTLHHLDCEAALRKMNCLLKPGGVAIVLGIGRSRSLPDYINDVLGFTASRCIRLFRGCHDHPAPKVAPKMTYREIRLTAKQVVPSCVFQRLLLFRFLLHWSKTDAIS